MEYKIFKGKPFTTTYVTDDRGNYLVLVPADNEMGFDLHGIGIVFRAGEGAFSDLEYRTCDPGEVPRNIRQALDHLLAN